MIQAIFDNYKKNLVKNPSNNFNFRHIKFHQMVCSQEIFSLVIFSF